MCYPVCDLKDTWEGRIATCQAMIFCPLIGQIFVYTRFLLSNEGQVRFHGKETCNCRITSQGENN
jgi:hypothetical protein